jgi:hypothetical protein
MPFRSAQADRWPKAPGGRIHSAHPAPGVGLRRHKERFSGRRRPTVGRRPLEAEFIRHTPRQASASADTKSAFPVGAGRPSAEGLLRPNSFGAPRARHRPPPTQETHFRSAQADRWPKALQAEFIRRPGRPSAEGLLRPNSFGAHADRRPKAFTPIEIGLLRRSRARRRPPPTQAALSVGAGRPLAEGPPRPNSFGAPRARRRPPPTQRALFRSAQADRWPKAPQGRIHSARPAPGVGLRRHKERFSDRRRPTVGRRPPKAEFIRHTPRQASASADAKPLPGRRRPTVGRRPPKVEFIRRAGRPSAEGPLRPNSFGAPRQASASADAKSAFPIGAGRPSAEGLLRPNSFGAPRARHRPPPTQRALFRSAQADRRLEALAPIEIGLLRRWRARRRPPPTQRALFRSAQADRRPKAS